jgi:hypothetical protein
MKIEKKTNPIMLAVLVKRATHDALYARAKAEETTVSNIVRQIIKAALSKGK